MSTTLNMLSSDFMVGLFLCPAVVSIEERENSVLSRIPTFQRSTVFSLMSNNLPKRFRVTLYLCSPCPRLLKDRSEFVFIPRSRQELPANFPEDIPGVCYFLEASFKTSKLIPKWSCCRPLKLYALSEHSANILYMCFWLFRHRCCGQSVKIFQQLNKKAVKHESCLCKILHLCKRFRGICSFPPKTGQ